MPFIAPLFAFGDSVIDAFNPTTWAFEGSIDVNPGAMAGIMTVSEVREIDPRPEGAAAPFRSQGSPSRAPHA